MSNYPPTTTPYERFFIGSSVLLPWRTVAGVFGKALNRLGKLPGAEVVKGEAGSLPPVMAA